MSSFTVWYATDITAEAVDHRPPTASSEFTSLKLKIETASDVVPFGYHEVTILGVPPALAHAIAGAVNAASEAMKKEAAE